MYAVIQTGGKQYRVEQGQTLRVEKLDLEPGASWETDQVLLIGGEQIKVGTPTVAGARVRATVLRHGKARKVMVEKFKAKVMYRRRKGHRQQFSEIRIE
ncbi:MAG: 50S ribosomal protein L21, partial [Deinococcus sp.]|nr:50S ribosomal protein L21 [Deinococcus sp.]